MHLVDTPGAPDFIGQSLPALEAVDTAAIVINAAPASSRWPAHDGVGGKAERDRMIVVNKIDAQGVDLAGAGGADPGRTFGRECLPLNLPHHAGRRHAGGGLLLGSAGRTPVASRTSPRWSRRTARWWSRWSRWTRPSSSATSTMATSTRASCMRRWSRRCAKAT
jgi:hypothetical protein